MLATQNHVAKAYYMHQRRQGRRTLSKVTQSMGTAAPINAPTLLGAKAEDGGLSEVTALKIPVIRLSQKGVTMYVGKMTSEELLRLWEIDRFREEDLEGYQRRIYDSRTQEILNYLVDCPVAVMPGILVSLHGVTMFRADSKGDTGTLEIPNRKGSVWVIDGQHRIGGFAIALNADAMGGLAEEENLNPDTLKNLRDYELPVVFIDSTQASQAIKNLADPSIPLSERDIERVVFFIVNKTAKSISPSLKDALAYKIKAAGIAVIPIIEAKPWRHTATKIALVLFRNGKVGSPFSGLMKITGIESRIARGTGRPLTLSAFVTSLDRLIQDDLFKAEQYDAQLEFVTAYWKAVRSMKPDAFTEPQHYMVLKSMGVYALNRLARDVFNWCKVKGIDRSEKNIKKFIDPLKEFDWTKKSSPIADFGGQKGVKASHKLLLRVLAKNGIEEAKEALAALAREGED